MDHATAQREAAVQVVAERATLVTVQTVGLAVAHRTVVHRRERALQTKVLVVVQQLITLRVAAAVLVRLAVSVV